MPGDFALALVGEVLHAKEIMGRSGGSKGAPPHSPKFSQLHAVFRKIWQNHRLAPPPRRENPGSAPGSHFSLTHADLHSCRRAKFLK